MSSGGNSGGALMRSIILIGSLCFAAVALPAAAQTSITREAGAAAVQASPIGEATSITPTQRHFVAPVPADNGAEPDIMELAFTALKAAAESDAELTREVMEDVRQQNANAGREVTPADSVVCIGGCPPKQ